jgi:hypothetical protein
MLFRLKRLAEAGLDALKRSFSGLRRMDIVLSATKQAKQSLGISYGLSFY